MVWNPWEKKSKSMVDLGDEEYKQMVCVDGAAIEKPITLKPGKEWTGRLQLSVCLQVSAASTSIFRTGTKFQ